MSLSFLSCGIYWHGPVKFDIMPFFLYFVHVMQVIALVLSDVVGNDLGFISSGPTVADFTTAQQCLDLLDTFGVMAAAPQSVVQLLRDQVYSYAGLYLLPL